MTFKWVKGSLMQHIEQKRSSSQVARAYMELDPFPAPPTFKTRRNWIYRLVIAARDQASDANKRRGT